MDPKLRKYLKRVCSLASGKARRKNSYRELRAFYLDKWDYLRSRGKTASEAWAAIFEDLPHPLVFGWRLRRSQQSFWRRHLFAMVGSFVLVVVLATGAVSTYILRSHYEPLFQSHLDVEERQLAMFERDLRLIEKHSFFHRGKNNSARDFIFTANRNHFSQEARAHLEKVWDRYQTIRRGVGNFKQEIAALPMEELALEWMDGAGAFDLFPTFTPEDEINIAKTSSRTMLERISALSSVRGYEVHAAFQQYAVLRAVQRCVRGQCREGLTELRSRARLLYTASSPMAQMLAIAMLRLESELAGKFGIDHTPAMPDEALNAYRRVSWAWRGLVAKSYMDPKPLYRLRNYMRPEFGFCSNVAESPLGFYNGMSDFFEPKWPLEADYSEEIEMDRKRAREWLQICDLKQLLPLVEGPVAAGDFWPKDEENIWTITGRNYRYLPSPSRLPYVRRIVGFMFISFAMPNYWNIYDVVPPVAMAGE